MKHLPCLRLLYGISSASCTNSIAIQNHTNWPWCAKTQQIFLAVQQQSSLCDGERFSPASH